MPHRQGGFAFVDDGAGGIPDEEMHVDSGLLRRFAAGGRRENDVGITQGRMMGIRWDHHGVADDGGNGVERGDVALSRSVCAGSEREKGEKSQTNGKHGV